MSCVLFEYGSTALHYVTYRGRADVVKVKVPLRVFVLNVYALNILIDRSYPKIVCLTVHVIVGFYV